MYAETVKAQVDRHVAPLVDAINRSTFAARTLFSCSDHKGRYEFPYVSFDRGGIAFVTFVLRCITRMNEVTGGSTYLQLRKIEDRCISGVIRLISYPSSDGRDWAVPPRRLVDLWWAELGVLADMIEQRRAEESEGFREFVSRQRWLTCSSTLRSRRSTSNEEPKRSA